MICTLPGESPEILFSKLNLFPESTLYNVKYTTGLEEINPSMANGFISDTEINLGYTKNCLVSERGIKSPRDINPSYHQLHKIKC